MRRHWKQPETTSSTSSSKCLCEQEFALAPGRKRWPAYRGEKLSDLWQRALRRRSPGSHGLINVLEIVPSQRLYRGTKNEVGVTLPTLHLMFLRRTYCSAHNLKNIGGGS